MSGKPPAQKTVKRKRRTNILLDGEAWAPPDFADRRPRIGASVVEQFVTSHDVGDVLRELVQNEFDGGGDSLMVLFDTSSLEVIGNGRGIDSDGWKRLAVILAAR